MALETGRGGEALAAFGFGASKVAFFCVGSLDVLLQVFLFDVVLVAVFVRASKGALIVMRPHVSRESCGPIEGLCAVGPGALDGLVVGREFAGRR